MRTLFANSDPWRELTRMQRELARLMSPFETAARPGVYPPANLYHSADAYLLRLEMPGVDASSLEIQSQRNELAITGERKCPEVPDDASYHRRERRFGKFRRTFALPESVDGEHADASYREGVLEVFLPKRPEAKPRQIAVATE